MPEDEAGAGEVLNAEEIELFAQDAMVAARGFFEAGEVIVEIFFREERRAVDALQLRILLVAEPVSAGEADDLEGFDAAGRGHMRAAAEVDEVAVAIEADLGAGRGELGDEVGLHEVAVFFKFGEGLLTRLVFADERLVARDDLGHFGFDGGEVFRREGLLAVEVVEEAGIGGGAVAELGLREELEDGRGQNVRGGVAQNLERVGIVFFDEFERVSEVSGAERSTRRGAAASSAAYMAASSADWPSELAIAGGALAAAVTGVMRAATEAAARRGEMELAMSRGVVPEGTSRMAPSGRCTAIMFVLIVVESAAAAE
jgi:hypothetical protein